MSTAARTAEEMEVEHQRFFEALTVPACRDLFAQYGVLLRQVGEQEQPRSPEFLVCSVISFSGRHLRGTLVLALTEELPTRSNPLGKGGAARDWVGELSNQLLGSIKIELLQHGVEIYLNLPAVLRGEHLAPLPRKALNPIKFVTDDGGAVAIWIELEIGPRFQISGAGDTEPGARSGETLLFE